MATTRLRIGGFLFAAAITLVPATAQGAEDPGATTAPTVVVTATRIPTPIGSVGSAVTVITDQDIERNGYKTLTDALKSVPGVTVRQSGGLGTQSSVFIRGTEARHVLFLLNGLDINDPSGAGAVYDPGQLQLDNVERIEIIRGPQSVLYGSDAIGGVVNVITKDGAGSLTAGISAEGGTLGTYKVAAGAGGSYDGLSGRFDVSRLETAGQNIAPTGTEDDGYENLTFSGTLGAELAENIDIAVFGQYVDAESEIDSFGFDDSTRVNLREQFFVRGIAEGSFFDGFWDATLIGGISNQMTENRVGGLFPSTSIFDGRIYEAGLQNDLHIHDGGILTLGIEADIESGASSGDSFFGFDEQQHTISYFAQYQFDFWDRVSGTAGVRLDDNEVFGTETTYRVALAYDLVETDTRLRGAVATGFNAPTLIDQFGFVPPEPLFDFDGFVGNPDLAPETSFGWEVGIEQRFWEERATIELTYFFNDLDNLIDPFFDAVPDDGVPATAVNIAAAETHGLEVLASLSPFPFIDVVATYTYLQTQNLTTGEPLLRRPTHEFSGEVIVRPTDDLRISGEAVYVGERADIDLIGSPASADDYTLFNLVGEYVVDEHVTVFVRATNLTDVDFEDPFGFSQPGREVFVGTRISLP